MTILPFYASNIPSASTSQHSLKEQRHQLQEIQSQIAHVDRIKSQLEQLLPHRDGKRTRRLSSSSETSSWSLASTSSKGSIASDIKGKKLLVPIAGVAFVPATISQTSQGNLDEERTSVFVRSILEGSAREEEIEKLVSIEERRGGKYREITITQAIAQLEEQRQGASIEDDYYADVSLIYFHSYQPWIRASPLFAMR